MREPAPPYVGEGPHALWHVSEDAVHRALRAARQRDGVELRAACLGGRHATPSSLLVSARVPARDFLGDARDHGARLGAPRGIGSRPPRRAGLARGAARRPGRRVPAGRGDVLARPGGRRLLAEPRAGGAGRGRRARRSARAPPPSRASSFASSPTSGRPGIASSHRRSSSAGSGSTTPAAAVRLGERSLLRHSGSPRETRQASRELSQHQQPVDVVLEPSRRAVRRRRRPARGRPSLADPQDRHASACDERETELCRDGRLGERLGERDTERVGRAPRRVPRRRARSRAIARRRVRGSSHFRRSASSSVNCGLGRLAASGIPGDPPPEPTSTTGPAQPLEQRDRPQRVVEEDAASVVEIGEPGRAGSRDHVLEPALEERRRHLSRASWRGRTTTKRFGSEPSLSVSTLRVVLQRLVDDLPLDGRHRLELDAVPRRRDTLGGSARDRSRASPCAELGSRTHRRSRRSRHPALARSHSRGTGSHRSSDRAFR